MIISILFYIYFLTSIFFCFIGSPIYYCVLLVINALLCSAIGYFVLGFGWYSLLFCLVYIGGVYILFIFVSVYSPNNNYVSQFNINIVLLGIIILTIGYFLLYDLLNVEFSEFLCKSNEGFTYIIMCLSLIFGFFILNIIMNVKLSHYR